MKCAVKQVLYDHRINSIQSTYDEMSQNFLKVLDASAGIALHAQKDVFGKIRLERFYAETLLGIWEDVEFCKSIEKERPEYRRMFSEREEESKERRQLRDSIDTVIQRNASELGKVGYDFYAEEDLFPLKFRERWLSPVEKRYRENRMAFYSQFSPTIQAYISGGLLHLRERYGFGPARMQPIHSTIRQYCNQYTAAWMDLQDSAAQKMQKDWMAQVRGYGVNMTYWTADKPPVTELHFEPIEELSWDEMKYKIVRFNGDNLGKVY